MYSNVFSGLLDLADLSPAMEAASNADAMLKACWAVAKDWSEENRYVLPGPTDAQQLYTAVADLAHGVLPWLRHYW